MSRPITQIIGEYRDRRAAERACANLKSPGVYWRPVPHPTVQGKFAIQRQV